MPVTMRAMPPMMSSRRALIASNPVFACSIYSSQWGAGIPACLFSRNGKQGGMPVLPEPLSFLSEREPRRELNLPRVENRPRIPVRRVERPFTERRSWSEQRIVDRAIRGMKDRIPVNGVEEPDVQRVEQVERFSEELQFFLLVNRK